MPRPVSIRRLCLLGFLLVVDAIDLSTFTGQAEMKLLVENVAGQEATPQAR